MQFDETARGLVMNLYQFLSSSRSLLPAEIMRPDSVSRRSEEMNILELRLCDQLHKSAVRATFNADIAVTATSAKETLHVVRNKNEFVSLTKRRSVLRVQRQSEVIVPR